MKEELKDLISNLYLGKITQELFLEKYFSNVTIANELHIHNLLEKAISNKDEGLVDEVIILLNTNEFDTSEFTRELCNLILLPWHKKHEDLAMLLQTNAHPSIVDVLFKAVQLNLEYLDYDDTYQFPRKCIKAISSIGDENSTEKLKQLAEYSIKEIAEYAKKELMKKGYDL
jgi:hypothetical protein